jgi:hypothetical protein
MNEWVGYRRLLLLLLLLLLLHHVLTQCMRGGTAKSNRGRSRLPPLRPLLPCSLTPG